MIFLLSFIQNVSFSMMSRARNRDRYSYLIATSLVSNTVWMWTLKKLMTSDFGLYEQLMYAAGTTAGTLAGVKVSMWIESLIGAKSDSHVGARRES